MRTIIYLSSINYVVMNVLNVFLLFSIQHDLFSRLDKNECNALVTNWNAPLAMGTHEGNANKWI